MSRRRVHSVAYIQRTSPGLSLEGAQLQSAFEHERPLPARPPGLEGPHAGPLPAHHAHVSLEGPQAAALRRPHVSTHGVSLEGGAPLRAALQRRQRLKGKPHALIRRSGIAPALISSLNKRK